jgi:hypothetical protein
MPTQGIFIAIVLAVTGLFVRAVRVTDRSAGRRMGVIAAVFIGWLAVPGVLAWQGVLDRYEPPPPGLLLVGAITLGTVPLAFSAAGSRFVAGLPLAVIVGYQAFRVPLEWVLHRLYLEGAIPIQMTYAGRNFDVVTGITAALLALWLATGRRHRGLVLAWKRDLSVHLAADVSGPGRAVRTPAGVPGASSMA